MRFNKDERVPLQAIPPKSLNPICALVLWFFPLGLLLVLLSRTETSWNDPWIDAGTCPRPPLSTNDELQLVANSLVDYGLVIIGLLTGLRFVNSDFSPQGRFYAGLSICTISIITFFEGGEADSPIGRLFDWFGLYLIGSLQLTRLLSRLCRLNLLEIFAVYIGSTAAMNILTNATWLSAYRSSTIAVEIAVLFGLALILLTSRHTSFSNRFLGVAVVVYVLANSFWFVDKLWLICWPTVIQGRSLWRALCILVLGCIDLFISSEKMCQRNDSVLPVKIEVHLPVPEAHPLVLA